MSTKKLDSKLEKELKDYILNHCPFIDDYVYEINDEGSEISFTYPSNMADTNIMFEVIKHVENQLNAKHIGIRAISSNIISVYRFNEKI